MYACRNSKPLGLEDKLDTRTSRNWPQGPFFSRPVGDARRSNRASRGKANLLTRIQHFRGFDSSRILIVRGGILMSIGNFPESLSQAILAGRFLVGRLGVALWDQERLTDDRGDKSPSNVGLGAQGDPSLSLSLSLSLSRSLFPSLSLSFPLFPSLLSLPLSPPIWCPGGWPLRLRSSLRSRRPRPSAAESQTTDLT